MDINNEWNKEDPPAVVGIKRYAVGRIYYSTKGPEPFRDEIRGALKTPGVCTLKAYVREMDLLLALISHGIPAPVADKVVKCMHVDDESAYVRADPIW